MRGLAGVYIIQSISFPQKVYVGSSFNLKNRMVMHFNQLERNKHHSPQLQFHYNKYGEDDLIIDFIECGDYLCKEHLLAREQGWFAHFAYPDSDKPFFNCCGFAGSNKGVVHGSMSQEHREKISNSKMGEKRTCRQRHNISVGHMGIKMPPFTQEHKNKIGNAHRGNESIIDKIKDACRVLSPSVVGFIRERCNNKLITGETYLEIASFFGVSYDTVYNIKSNRTYKE